MSHLRNFKNPFPYKFPWYSSYDEDISVPTQVTMVRGFHYKPGFLTKEFHIPTENKSKFTGGCKFISHDYKRK